MADNEFQVEAMGEVYAQALYNEALKGGVLEEVMRDVRGIGELLEKNEAFRGFVAALTIGEEERLASLTKIFSGRVHPLVLETLKSMSRRDRLIFLRGLVEAFEAILKKVSGHVDVSLVSASELSPATVERVKDAVGRSLGRTADLSVKVDGRLIAGMMLTVGDTLFDGSVSTQLAKMKEQLKRKGVGQMKIEKVVV